MGKKEIIKIIRNSKAEIESHFGVQRLGLFGSCVREKQKKSSDIDILVTFNHDIDLFDFFDLREYLENRLSTKVDLVMAPPLIKIDPFVLMRHDPEDAQLIGWQS